MIIKSVHQIIAKDCIITHVYFIIFKQNFFFNINLIFKKWGYKINADLNKFLFM